jgi:conjugal transfer pilus assembly protein TraD
VKAFFACQTVGDFDAVFGTNAVTRQALGNLNNVICFRVKDVEMAKLLSESFGKTVHRTLRTGISSNSGAVGAQMTEVEIPLVSQDVLTRLPGLQYFAFLAGSALWKGRLPVIT